MVALAIWGAFAVGIGVERLWPATEYGGAPAAAWLSGGAVAIVVAVIGYSRHAYPVDTCRR